MIQLARAKRAWEATLPPLDGIRQLHKRKQMMEEWVTEEWAFREAKIQRLVLLQLNFNFTPFSKIVVVLLGTALFQLLADAAKMKHLEEYLLFQQLVEHFSIHVH